MELLPLVELMDAFFLITPEMLEPDKSQIALSECSYSAINIQICAKHRVIE